MSRAQPIPDVTQDDVERIVRRDFSADEYARVMGILNEYGTETWHREVTRVQLAVLRTSNANVETLRACVESAKGDYRDALAAAEYPGYLQMDWGRNRPTEEIDRIIESDWRQYAEWLKRRG